MERSNRFASTLFVGAPDSNVSSASWTTPRSGSFTYGGRAASGRPRSSTSVRSAPGAGLETRSVDARTLPLTPSLLAESSARPSTFSSSTSSGAGFVRAVASRGALSVVPQFVRVVTARRGSRSASTGPRTWGSSAHRSLPAGALSMEESERYLERQGHRAWWEEILAFAKGLPGSRALHRWASRSANGAEEPLEIAPS